MIQKLEVPRIRPYEQWLPIGVMFFYRCIYVIRSYIRLELAGKGMGSGMVGSPTRRLLYSSFPIFAGCSRSVICMCSRVLRRHAV